MPLHACIMQCAVWAPDRADMYEQLQQSFLSIEAAHMLLTPAQEWGMPCTHVHFRCSMHIDEVIKSCTYNASKCNDQIYIFVPIPVISHALSNGLGSKMGRSTRLSSSKL